MTTPNITRRTALKAAPAVALTAAVPGMAGADPESELILALRQWRADYQALNDQRPPDMSDEDYGVVVDLSTARLDALLAIPAETPRELAMKVVMSDIDAGRNLRHQSEVMTQELYRLARFDDGARTAGVFPSAPPESEVMRLFREWQAADAAWKTKSAPDDDLDEGLGDEVWAIVYRMLALPSQNITDFAAKLIAMCDWDDDGCFSAFASGGDSRAARRRRYVKPIHHIRCTVFHDAFRFRCGVLPANARASEAGEIGPLPKTLPSRSARRRRFSPGNRSGSMSSTPRRLRLNTSPIAALSKSVVAIPAPIRSRSGS